MLQPTPNQTELRLMVSKSFFNVDSKNVSEKFLHRHSWKKSFFSDFFLWSPKVGFEKKKTFFQEWRWRNFSLTFLESTLKMVLETMDLSSVWFGVSCNIGWVISVISSMPRTGVLWQMYKWTIYIRPQFRLVRRFFSL